MYEMAWAPCARQDLNLHLYLLRDSRGSTMLSFARATDRLALRFAATPVVSITTAVAGTGTAELLLRRPSAAAATPVAGVFCCRFGWGRAEDIHVFTFRCDLYLEKCDTQRVSIDFPTVGIYNTT